MPQLVVQEADDGIGEALLVIHLETGRDDVWNFQELQTPAKIMRTGAAQTGPFRRCPQPKHIGPFYL